MSDEQKTILTLSWILVLILLSCFIFGYKKTFKYLDNFVTSLGFLVVLPILGLITAIVNFPYGLANGIKKYEIKPKDEDL